MQTCLLANANALKSSNTTPNCRPVESVLISKTPNLTERRFQGYSFVGFNGGVYGNTFTGVFDSGAVVSRDQTATRAKTEDYVGYVKQEYLLMIWYKMQVALTRE